MTSFALSLALGGIMAENKSTVERAREEGRLPPENKPETIDLKGFKNLNPEAAFGWFKKSAGAICYGEYLGRFEKTWDRPDEDEDDTAQYYHQVRIWAGTMATVTPPEGGKGVEKMAPKGSILNMDESKALEAMRDLPTQNNGKHVVYVKYVDKRQNRRDARKTFWNAEVKVRDMKSNEAPF